jgi:hypothetical protein
MVKAPGLRGAHKQEKPASLMDYNECKIWVSKLDKILSYHCFQGKSVKWLKKIVQFFSLNSKVPHSFLHSFQSGAENMSVFEEGNRTCE